MLCSAPCFSDKYKNYASLFVTLHMAVKLAKAFLVFLVWHTLIFISTSMTVSGFTQVYFIYNCIYINAHMPESCLFSEAELKSYICSPFKEVQEWLTRGQNSSKKKWGSVFVIPQPTKLHLSEKKTEENFAKGSAHVPFGSFPMNIYAGGNIWHLKTKQMGRA